MMDYLVVRKMFGISQHLIDILKKTEERLGQYEKRF